MIDLIFLLMCLLGFFGFMSLDRWHDKRVLQIRLKHKAKWEMDLKKIEHEFKEKRHAIDLKFIKENWKVTHLPIFILFRQDDNGNRALVKHFFGREEAEKALNEYNEKSHKQLYWLEVNKKDLQN